MTADIVRRLACLAAVVSTHSAAAVAEPSTRPFRDSIGINVKFTQGESPRDLMLLKELGVHWVRDTASWPDVEPVAGQYKSFPMSFRERLAFYKENDIGVVFGLWYDNPAAYPNTADDATRSTDADAYGRYAAEVARQLNQSGVRYIIELYNEPHNTLIKTYGGKWNGESPSPWLDHYVKMVDAAVTQVKAFDAKVRLLVDDDMWAIHYRFLEHGLPKAIDGLAFHPYAKHVPERAAVDQDTDWARPFTMVDADGSFGSAVRRLPGARERCPWQNSGDVDHRVGLARRRGHGVSADDGGTTCRFYSARVPRGERCRRRGAALVQHSGQRRRSDGSDDE